MPELPEVETMRRGIGGIVGGVIEGVRFVRTRCKPITVTPSRARFRRRVVGESIDSVERIGKRVVVMLGSDDAIVFEPRMTGLVLVADPPNRDHLRLEFDLAQSQHPSLAYWDRRGLGSVRVMDREERQVALGPRHLGPDALAITPDEMQRRLGNRRTAVKVALLDQVAVAGIGNLYASEILFVARVDPGTPCLRITRPKWQAIHAATQHVLQEAIRYEGSTLGDGTYRNALNEQGSYQNHHRVYQRHGHPCLVCRKGVIVRIVQGQRATFFCPRCQKGK